MLKVKVRHLEGFDSEQLKIVNKSLFLLEKVLNSKLFREKVLAYRYKRKKRFYMNDGKSNTKIYQEIMQGAEILDPTVDYEADLYLNLDKSPRRGTVIGYTNRGTNHIYTYESWFDENDPIDYAGHIAHEWCHKLGYRHSKRRSKKRKHTVPYAVGTIVRKLSAVFEHHYETEGASQWDNFVDAQQ